MDSIRNDGFNAPNDGFNAPNDGFNAPNDGFNAPNDGFVCETMDSPNAYQEVSNTNHFGSVSDI